MKTPSSALLPICAILLALPMSASSQVSVEQATKTACATALAKVPLPKLDPRLEGDCDSPALYYGIGRDKDYAAAAACAEIENFKQVNKDGSLFTGAGVLSMVYANGEGVTRDLDTARYYVCSNPEADTKELAERLKVLDRIAATPLQPPHFDLCKTASSGTSEGWCATIEVRLHDARRYTDLVKIFTELTPAGQEAFKKLQIVEGEFEDVRSAKELDQTGTARGALSLAEEDRLRSQFVSDLKLFAKPDFSQPVTLAVVDGRVNGELSQLQATAAKKFSGTTITAAGIAETQAAYMKLRTEWRAYAAIAYPAVPADAIATQLARERLFQLHKLNLVQ